MKNVEISEKGTKLVVEIDRTKDFGPSKTRKTVIIASTEGNIRLADGSYIGLTMYRPIMERRGI